MSEENEERAMEEALSATPHHKADPVVDNTTHVTVKNISLPFESVFQLVVQFTIASVIVGVVIGVVGFMLISLFGY
jgi:hypothetical protein